MNGVTSCSGVKHDAKDIFFFVSDYATRTSGKILPKFYTLDFGFL